MHTKKVVAALAAILLTFSICSLTLGARGTRAVANDSQGLFIPNVDDNWNVNAHTEQERYQAASPRQSESGVTAKTTASRRLAVADNRAKEKGVEENARETVAAGLVRTVLPWLAGAFAIIGLAMVAYGLLIRGRRRPDQAVRSVAFLNGSRAGKIQRTHGPAGLASCLARAELPQTQDEEQVRKLRRAA